MSELPPSRAHLLTEAENESSHALDLLSTLEATELFFNEEEAVHRAVKAAAQEVGEAVDLIAEKLRAGGRLFYVGAGTSGRLAVLDAAECPPTFGSDPEQIQAVLAGGAPALLRSSEGLEDEFEGSWPVLRERKLCDLDVLLGISAGGTTPFVHGALAHARAVGAACVFLACVPREQAAAEADVDIRLLTGPELIAGSTRLKAGTATKLALNAISSLVMVRLGKVYGNLMVDVNALANDKLVDRALRLLEKLCATPREAGLELLHAAGGSVKCAVLMARRGLEREAAEQRLRASAGDLRSALEADRSGSLQ